MWRDPELSSRERWICQWCHLTRLGFGPEDEASCGEPQVAMTPHGVESSGDATVHMRAEPTSWCEGFETLAFESLALLPTSPGVYVVSRGEEVLYAGGASNLRARWRWHHRAGQLGALGPGLVLRWHEDAEYQAAERRLIGELRPSLNGTRLTPRDGDLAVMLQEPQMTEEELDAAEAVIAKHLTHFLEVGRLLVRIRSSRVYRYLGYRTFERYLAERIGLSRRTGYLYLDAAQVAETLRDEGVEAPECANATHEVDRLPINLGVSKLASLAPLPDPERAELAVAAAREHLTVTQLRGLVAEKLRVRRPVVSAPPLVYQLLIDEAHDPKLTTIIQVVDAGALPWPDGACDLILTSPPYCLGAPYAEGGDVVDYPTYRRLMAVWAAELYRVSQPEHGRLCLNVPVDRTRDSHEAIYAHWVAALEEAGWCYRTTIFWLENQAGSGAARGTDSPDAPAVHAPLETVIVVYRGQWSRHEARPHDLGHDDWLRLCGPRGLWVFPGVAHPTHPAPFPEELALRCIRLYTYRADVVADPFAGSGTTPAMAMRLGRRLLAGDRAAAYVALTRAWVAKEHAAAARPRDGGTHSYGAAPDQAVSRSSAVTVELACLLCGRPIAEGGRQCGVCGGSAIPSDTAMVRRTEPALDWADDRPRRGRPPRRLADLNEDESRAMISGRPDGAC
jgi:site-specific DNA-methyltransferase (adenine-specific)